MLCVISMWLPYCTVLLSPKSNAHLQQPKRRSPTNLSSAHSNICSSFCHDRVYKGLFQCLLFRRVMRRNHFLPTLLMSTRQNANNLGFARMNATIGFYSLCATPHRSMAET
jgi:hypothetical protein